MNQYPTIDNIDLANKKVLLRADLNVPLKGFEKSYRVQRLLPTIEELIQNLTFFYEEFFNDIKSYNFINFKKKADLLLINNI